MQILKQSDVFLLGFAYGSFSVGEVDQGIHILIPSTIHEIPQNEGRKENDVFTTLFEKYFDKLNSLTGHVGEVYMGAIDAWLKDNDMDMVVHTNKDHIKTFEAAICKES
jgi:hypothetical protein